MTVNGDKDNFAITYQFINSPQITGNIETAVIQVFPFKRMVIQDWMVGILQK